MIVLTGKQVIEEARIDWEQFCTGNQPFDEWFPEQHRINPAKTYLCSGELTEIEELSNDKNN